MTSVINIREHLETHHGTQLASRLKQIVYGGVDGVITTFSIIATSIAINLAPKFLIILAVSNVVSDGLSMACGDFISSYSEKRYTDAEKQKERNEYRINFSGEKEELTQLYVSDGMSREDAEGMIDILTRYPEIFLDHMMYKELGLLESESIRDIIKNALATFVSFIVYGSIPVVSFAILFVSGVENDLMNFGITAAITAISLFLIGVLDGFITKQNIFYSGLLITINGGIATVAAYFVGFGLNKIG